MVAHEKMELITYAKSHSLTHYLIETPFNTFANRADPDQAALVSSCLFAYGHMIRYDHTLEDLTCNFFIYFMYKCESLFSGWSLA